MTRTRQEIQAELDRLMEIEAKLSPTLPANSEKYNNAAAAAQALVWVLGEELSPVNMIEEIEE